jgi:hypothetical protein
VANVKLGESEEELRQKNIQLTDERDRANDNATLAEKARGLAESNERKAKKAEEDALTARDESMRANRRLQEALDKERKRIEDLENQSGSKPVPTLPK